MSNRGLFLFIYISNVTRAQYVVLCLCNVIVHQLSIYRILCFLTHDPGHIWKYQIIIKFLTSCVLFCTKKIWIGTHKSWFVIFVHQTSIQQSIIYISNIVNNTCMYVLVIALSIFQLKVRIESHNIIVLLVFYSYFKQ